MGRVPVGERFSVNCKACNTRVPMGQAHCPHCGREVHPGRRNESVDSDPAALSASGRRPLAPSTIVSSDEDREEKDSIGSKAKAARSEEEVQMSATITGTKVRGRAAKKGRTVPRTRKKEEAATAEVESNSFPSSAALSMPVEASQIRHLISERPELLESELSVFIDGESQHRGIGFETDVGEIDLLARASTGDFVVVMVVDAEGFDEAIAGMLQRVGWVRKHLSAPDHRVRGILLVERMDESTRYTAAALADSVSFLTWRLSLQFESLLS